MASRKLTEWGLLGKIANVQTTSPNYGLQQFNSPLPVFLLPK